MSVPSSRDVSAVVPGGLHSTGGEDGRWLSRVPCYPRVTTWLETFLEWYVSFLPSAFKHMIHVVMDLTNKKWIRE